MAETSSSQDPANSSDADADRGRQAVSPHQITMSGWKDVAKRVAAEIKSDHTALSASGVAFFLFLAVIPGLAALVSLYGIFVSPEKVQEQTESMFSALPPEAKNLLKSQLTRVVEQSGGALGLGLAISIALALWTASSGFAHLVEAINITYDESESRNFFKLRGLALTLTVGAIVVFTGTGVIVSRIPGLLGSNPAVEWILQIVAWLVAGVVVLLCLSMLYRVGPNRQDAKWRWVTPGSLVATVLAVLASVGFQIYVANFSSYNETYGSLAAVVIMMFWLFLISFLVLLGAEINSELEKQTERDSTTGPEQQLGKRGATAADTVAPAQP